MFYNTDMSSLKGYRIAFLKLEEKYLEKVVFKNSSISKKCQYMSKFPETSPNSNRQNVV